MRASYGPRQPGRGWRLVLGGSLATFVLLVGVAPNAARYRPAVDQLRAEVAAGGLDARALGRLARRVRELSNVKLPPARSSRRGPAAGQGAHRISTTRGAGCDPARDLRDARLDARVVKVLDGMARRYAIRVSCLKRGHSRYVKGTRRTSNHYVWRGVDVDRVDGRPVSPSNRAARDLAEWLVHLGGPLAPSEVGSPWPLGGRAFTDEGHQDHLHVGWRPR